MFFLRGGPDIPSEVVRAQEEGRLAIVCGAGISKPNGLPLYSELVENVRERLGSAPNEETDAAISGAAFDRAMGYLERRYGRERLYEEVREQLRVPDDPDLRTHEAVLALGTGRDGRLQLVTTNFDLLFEAARPGIPYAAAPTLPVSKRARWNSLVYLHGRLTDGVSDDLVMSTADFGRAYLTERWGSRFVSGLFAHFTVLFVGYSLEDPVMRYLVDAVAAEGQVAYAFAEVGLGEDPADVAREWELKNAHAVPYDVESEHSDVPHGCLHDTLREWASLYEGGLESRKNVVNQFASDDPASLPIEERTKLIWAIQDPAAASHLADLGSDTHFGWYRMFEALMASAPTAGEGGVAFTDWGQRSVSPGRLGGQPFQIARWLASHVADPALVRWAIEQGGRVHPEVARLIGSALERSSPPVPPAVAKAWGLILGDDVAPYYERGDIRFYGLPKQIGDPAPWDAALRRNVLVALSPGLTFGRSFTGMFNFAEGQGTKKPQDLFVSDLMGVDVELAAGGSTREVADALLSRTDKDTVLSDLAWDLTSLLRRVFDMLACADSANVDFDPCVVVRRSIEANDQDNNFRSWMWLVDLNREAFLAYRRADPGRAESLVEEWSRIEYPTFRRLTMYAAARLLEDG